MNQDMIGPMPMNWRDVGATLHSRFGTAALIMPAARLLRCGIIDQREWQNLGAPRTVVNLRIQRDEVELPPGVVVFHIAAENTLEKYDVSDKGVANWLASCLIAMQDARPPVLVHCRSGRDRTGVVVAAVLKVLGVPDTIITQEYLVSSGARLDLFQKTLAGLNSSSRWLRGVNVRALRKVFAEEADDEIETIYLKERIQTIHSMSLESTGEERNTLCRLLVDACDAKLCVTESTKTCKTWIRKGWAMEQLGDFRSAADAYTAALELSVVPAACAIDSNSNSSNNKAVIGAATQRVEIERRKRACESKMAPRVTLMPAAVKRQISDKGRSMFSVAVAATQAQ